MNESKTNGAAMAAGPATPPILPTLVSLIAAYLQCQTENGVLQREVDYTRAVLQQCQGEGEKRIADLTRERDELAATGKDYAEVIRIYKLDAETHERNVRDLDEILSGKGNTATKVSLGYLVSQIRNQRNFFENQHGMDPSDPLWNCEPARPVSSYLTAKAKAGGLNPHDAQLLQLMSGPVADKDLLSVSVRNELVEKAYVTIVSGGFNTLAHRGVAALVERGLIQA